MAIRDIVKEGNELLRKTSREVSTFDDKLATLICDMAETMYEADGVGLAAPQVGILRRVVVIDVGDGLVEMVNPVIVEQSGSQIGPEGCLSVPKVHGDVERPLKLKVEYQDRHGNKKKTVAKDFFAVAICHELDHLDGVLFIDKMIRR